MTVQELEELVQSEEESAKSSVRGRATAFPARRMRRLRQNEAFRRLVREHRLAVDNLLLPLFVVPGYGVRRK
jgi:porphobilinogen synthase